MSLTPSLERMSVTASTPSQSAISSLARSSVETPRGPRPGRKTFHDRSTRLIDNWSVRHTNSSPDESPFELIYTARVESINHSKHSPKYYASPSFQAFFDRIGVNMLAMISAMVKRRDLTGPVRQRMEETWREIVALDRDIEAETREIERLEHELAMWSGSL